MAEEVRIWQVSKEDELTPIDRAKLDREERVEKWISSDISLLSPDLLVIGQQVETESGNFIDLLCIDRSGNLVIVELKRDKTPREVTAQALDYASWVKQLDAEAIARIASDYLKDKALEVAFRSKFGAELPDVINEHHAMLVVASEIDDSTERIIQYLSESYGVDINAVRFQFFQAQDGREFLVRTFTVAPQQVVANATRASTRRTPPTPDEMFEVAKKAGVEQLFKQGVDMLSEYLRPKWGKAVCSFTANLPDGPRNAVVFSLEPGDSSAQKGLSYSTYSKRLARGLGIDEQAVLSNLPPNGERFIAWKDCPQDFIGWMGFIRNGNDLQKIVEMIKKLSSAGSDLDERSESAA